MKVTLFDEVAAFATAIEPVLAKDPVRNTIAVTVLSRLLADPSQVNGSPIMLAIHDIDAVCGFLFCTPPWPAMVTAVPPAAAPAVVDQLLVNGLRVVGANGAVDEATAFVKAWTDATGDQSKILMRTRLYRLGELVPPADVPGEMALGSAENLALLTAWRQGFASETAHGRVGRPPVDEQTVRHFFEVGDASLLWQVNGEPVSLAGASAPRNGMSRIGPVYTPPEHRGHGYGSAVTAAASTWALAAGARDVLLFTDLANPVSNSIYQRIGYHPVCDALEVGLRPA